jgi:hypothetical protein
VLTRMHGSDEIDIMTRIVRLGIHRRVDEVSAEAEDAARVLVLLG